MIFALVDILFIQFFSMDILHISFLILLVVAVHAVDHENFTKNQVWFLLFYTLKEKIAST